MIERPPCPQGPIYRGLSYINQTPLIQTSGGAGKNPAPLHQIKHQVNLNLIILYENTSKNP